MELAVATKQGRTGSALAMAIGHLVLLFALACGVSYVAPACINFVSGQANEESRSSAAVANSSSKLQIELVCDLTAPRIREHSACELPE
jgi:hypothetical protein